MIRLVATDLDGTLLRSDFTLGPRTVDVLSRMSADGMHIALVTGRPLRWMSAVYAQLPLPIPAVCANGAVIYDPATDSVLRADPLAPSLLVDVCARLRESIPDAAFAVEIEDSRSMRHEEGYAVRWDAGSPTVRAIESVDQLCAVPAAKLMVRATGVTDSDGFAALVASCVDGLVETTHSSRTGLVEISAAGVTKAAGLAWLCERLGIDAAHVIAFGDMPNDVPMLAWAGRAVAVANAHPAALAAADDTTGSNDDDGVAAYLTELLEMVL